MIKLPIKIEFILTLCSPNSIYPNKNDKNIKLATYASRCIDNEILMFIRTSKKTKAEVFLNESIGKDKDDNVVIYTNELGIKSKTVGNIQLKKMDLVSFDHRTKSIITALELLEKGFNNE